MASGLSGSLVTLVIARAFVGVGEASYATLAPTIIDDVSSPRSKGRMLAIFFVAIPIGSAAGYLLGGYVQKVWGWRAAFFIGGGPGIALALLCLAIEEPKRKLAAAREATMAAIARTLGLRVADDARRQVRRQLYLDRLVGRRGTGVADRGARRAAARGLQAGRQGDPG